MQFVFDNNINDFLKIILKNAQDKNLRVFFVGGMVRDKILDIPISDIDILLQGDAIEFADNLPDCIDIVSKHIDFGTVKLKYNDIEIDIASSRSESYPYSGCLPIVNEIGVSIEKDVKRRDFTINSLYCELELDNENIRYKIIDLVDGLKDLSNKTLKVLHDSSYIDDPSRILRGLDFRYRFNFEFSQKDVNLIIEYLGKINYENMSHDRILKVFNKILSGDYKIQIFKEIINKKYYKLIGDYELKIDFDLLNDFPFAIGDMSSFLMKLLLNKDVEVMEFASNVDIVKKFSKFSDSELAYYFYKTKDENVLRYQKFKNIKLFIDGNILINLGYQRGILIGKILDNLLNEKLNNPDKFSDKDKELEWVFLHFPKK